MKKKYHICREENHHSRERNNIRWKYLGLWFMRGSRGGGGGGIRGSAPPLENHRAIEFLSNTGAEPLENHKATKSAFNVGPLSARQ